MKKIIAVIGSDGAIPMEVAATAEQIGAEIARKGFVLLCGGRGGVMEAACKGAKKEDGLTIGVLPFLDKTKANKHVDIALSTSLGYARNTIVASTPDAIIAIHGSAGTLSEIAMALNYGKPVIAVESTGGITAEIGKIKLNPEYSQLIKTSTPEKAVETAEKLIQ